MELGVVQPAREVGEGGGDDPRHVLLDDPVLPRAGAEDVTLGVGEDVVDRLEVAVVDDGLRLRIGERPGDRHRLRRIEAIMRPSTLLF